MNPNSRIAPVSAPENIASMAENEAGENETVAERSDDGDHEEREEKQRRERTKLDRCLQEILCGYCFMQDASSNPPRPIPKKPARGIMANAYSA